MKKKRSNKPPTPVALGWLRLVVMVKNTEANRTMCRILPKEGRRLAERFEGEKIVKCEAIEVWAMHHAKS